MANPRRSIPIFFDITKYEGAQQFSPLRWASNLIPRESDFRVVKMIRDGDLHFPDEASRRAVIVEIYRTCMRRIQQPLLPAVSDECINRLDLYHRLEDERAVNEITVNDLIQMYRGVRAAAPAAGCSPDAVARHFEPDTDCSELPADRQLHQLGSQRYRTVIDSAGELTRDGDRVFFRVDIHAPIEKIERDFMSCLQEIRKEVEIENLRRPFDRRDFERWHHMKLLAYIDLSTIEVLRGKKFTLEEIGQELFPNEIELSSLADRVRRSVRPRAMSLMTMQAVSVLAAQVRASSTRSK